MNIINYPIIIFIYKGTFVFKELANSRSHLKLYKQKVTRLDQKVTSPSSNELLSFCR